MRRARYFAEPVQGGVAIVFPREPFPTPRCPPNPFPLVPWVNPLPASTLVVQVKIVTN